MYGEVFRAHHSFVFRVKSFALCNSTITINSTSEVKAITSLGKNLSKCFKIDVILSSLNQGGRNDFVFRLKISLNQQI